MSYIIAEAGTGHFSPSSQRRLELAMDFITAAATAGADAVKFQMFVADERLFCPMPGDEERMARWNQTCLTLDTWRYLKLRAEALGVDLLWSVFQPTCVSWLKALKPRMVKVASRAAEKFPYGEFVDYPTIVSMGTGLHYPMLGQMLQFRLDCISKYPTPLEEAGYAPENGHDGLSDHSGTIWPGLDAIAHDAKMLEVHFKIPGADMGNDEPVCLTTDQLKLLCEARDAFARMHQ